jgi:hypothetical protein
MSGRSAAAAGTAAATAAAARRGAAVEARLRRARVGGEDRELLADVGGAAFRTVGLLAVSDELFEVRLARHADVFVDRHRRAVYRRPPTVFLGFWLGRWWFAAGGDSVESHGPGRRRAASGREGGPEPGSAGREAHPARKRERWRGPGCGRPAPALVATSARSLSDAMLRLHIGEPSSWSPLWQCAFTLVPTRKAQEGGTHHYRAHNGMSVACGGP